MKEFNLKVKFTENGSAYIHVFTPYFLNNDNEQCSGLSFSSQDAAMRHAKFYTSQLGYTLLYISERIVFIK